MVNKKPLVILGIVIIIATSIYFYYVYARFSGYEVKSNINLDNTQRTLYKKAFDELLCYNPDGASLTSFSGTDNWNISFEMQNPIVDLASDYAIIYDKRGSVVEVIDKDGEQCKISTSYPVSLATISDNGIIAVMMQQAEVAYINVYTFEGDVVAEGQIHCSSSGYPLSISLSPNGRQMAISTLHISEADVKSDIIFYNLSKDSGIQDSDKIAKFSYSNDIVPIVDFVGGNRLIAFGGDVVRIFNVSSQPSEGESIFFADEIKSVFHNEEYFGVIYMITDENGAPQNELAVYSISGKIIYYKAIPNTYNKCEFNSKNEVVILNEKELFIYTSKGVNRLECELDGEIQEIIPGKSFKDYFFIQNGQLLNVKIK